MMGNAGVAEKFTRDYSILQNPSHHDAFIRALHAGKEFLICKEELENNKAKGECQYDIFSSPSAYDMVRPIFLVRDPIRVYDSWKKVEWTEMQSLIDCYVNIFRILNQAP